VNYVYVCWYCRKKTQGFFERKICSTAKCNFGYIDTPGTTLIPWEQWHHGLTKDEYSIIFNLGIKDCFHSGDLKYSALATRRLMDKGLIYIMDNYIYKSPDYFRLHHVIRIDGNEEFSYNLLPNKYPTLAKDIASILVEES